MSSGSSDDDYNDPCKDCALLEQSVDPSTQYGIRRSPVHFKGMSEGSCYVESSVDGENDGELEASTL